jgi:hypothetical protein
MQSVRVGTAAQFDLEGNRMRVATGAALVALCGVAGCGGEQQGPPAPGPAAAAASTTTTVSANEPQGPREYATVAALKDAAVAAGMACPTWKQDDVVEVAAESGTCSDSTVLSTYATTADLQTAVENMRGMKKMLNDNGIEPTPLLIGPNWIINAAEAPTLVDGLGGTVER